MRWVLSGLVSLVLAAAAQAGLIVPDGFGVTDLGISAPAFGVSANGRLATATSSGDTTSITLYDTYQVGRQVIGTATITGTGGSFPTDITFANDDTLYVGDNGGGDTLHQVTFSGGTGTVASFANGTFGGIQSIAIRGNTMTVSGTDVTDFSPGDYYLKTLDLSANVLATSTISNSTITTVDGGAGIGPGYVGGTAVTASGRGVLLDSVGTAFVYDLLTADREEIGVGAPGLYAVTLDNEGSAYITAGGEIRLLADIEGLKEAGAFGSFTGTVFTSGIAFTGDLLQAFQYGYNGALIVNYLEFGEDFSVIGGGLLAVTALPEPAMLSTLALAPIALLRRRRTR